MSNSICGEWVVEITYTDYQPLNSEVFTNQTSTLTNLVETIFMHTTDTSKMGTYQIQIKAY